ncbi:hypothetical protein, partial [Pseudomonas syringae group genomosp. 7]|uniref:hypothetical protein n=1 Tax=Pseudomonas syringae group genomosp. 7 TaxID=251699 RepID=UPI00376FD47F
VVVLGVGGVGWFVVVGWVFVVFGGVGLVGCWGGWCGLVGGCLGCVGLFCGWCWCGGLWWLVLVEWGGGLLGRRWGLGWWGVGWVWWGWWG